MADDPGVCRRPRSGRSAEHRFELAKMVLRQRQGAELCEAAEDARNRLREVNTQIAKARASRDSQHLIQSAAHR